MNKIAALIIVGVLLLAGFIIFSYQEWVPKDKLKDQPIAYEIIEEWKLPEELEEISGIDWMGNNKLACIQDEEGIIFIFNLNTSKVENKIDFAGPGDYEDIRVIGKHAYVLRSDGEIFEVKDYLSGNPKTKAYSNFLSEKQNLESLAWDKKNNRLLLAVKDREIKNDSYKGVYEFSLINKGLKKEPVYRLEMEDQLLNDRDTEPRKKLQPSALGLHPINNSYYILDNRGSQLVIASNELKLEKRYALSENDFEKAEGITFSGNGRIFISNEGKGEKANILEVVFN